MTIHLFDNPCPCKNQKNYHECCELVHQDCAHAHHPEQLMRARYSAYVLGLVDFIVKTYHPSCNAQLHRDEILQSIKNQWVKLEIISRSVNKNGQEGYVEFKAHYLEKGKIHCLHEKSRFVAKEEEGKKHWYYIDGEYPKTLNVSRNDPCPCGSGKKYKKCCG